ncbi:hypothetical protein L6452_05903 [Arctium lappa]|uniref:Uncharacterized protein n=1 Tax=Arctium lappa TaxID=4217 RepID=A0ACB9EIE0_ARCLA|nr:hypothetical protein L6452_05903 [Arctium lappa]
MNDCSSNSNSNSNSSGVFCIYLLHTVMQLLCSPSFKQAIHIYFPCLILLFVIKLILQLLEFILRSKSVSHGRLVNLHCFATQIQIQILNVADFKQSRCHKITIFH